MKNRIRILLKSLDLAFTIIFTLLYDLLFFVSPEETFLRVVLSLLLLLFLPGYSLIVTLFPGSKDLDSIERVALSFGLSITIVPLLSLVLNYTPFGIRSMSVLNVISFFVISLSILAWVRRIRLPDEQRFRVPFESLIKVKSLFSGKRVIDRTLSLILVASIIASCETLVNVVVTPKTGERFTEFYILGPEGKASEYPNNLKLGEEAEVIIGIVNHEYENLTYRLEVRLNGSIIYEEYVLLFHNQTLEVPFRFKATKIGLEQKLEFLLYKDEEKETYRKLHLWVDVEG